MKASLSSNVSTCVGIIVIVGKELVSDWPMTYTCLSHSSPAQAGIAARVQKQVGGAQFRSIGRRCYQPSKLLIRVPYYLLVICCHSTVLNV